MSLASSRQWARGHPHPETLPWACSQGAAGGGVSRASESSRLPLEVWRPQPQTPLAGSRAWGRKLRFRETSVVHLGPWARMPEESYQVISFPQTFTGSARLTARSSVSSGLSSLTQPRRGAECDRAECDETPRAAVAPTLGAQALSPPDRVPSTPPALGFGKQVAQREKGPETLVVTTTFGANRMSPGHERRPC